MLLDVKREFRVATQNLSKDFRDFWAFFMKIRVFSEVLTIIVSEELALQSQFL